MVDLLHQVSDIILCQAVVKRFLAFQLVKLKRATMSKTQQPETIIEENKAATAIQTCFRGYRDFVRFIMKLFSAIQIQTAVRGYQTRCYLQRLKQEEERMSLQNAAATAIQSCFRGYQDFSTLIIMQHFVCEIQARVRGHQVRCRLREFKRGKRQR